MLVMTISLAPRMSTDAFLPTWNEYDTLIGLLMLLVDIQRIGNELAVKWDDGRESFISLEALRRSCPCAGCQGEVDVLGNLHINPPKELEAAAFELERWILVGGYAIQPVWADGHSSGLFSFEYLRKVADTN